MQFYLRCSLAFFLFYQCVAQDAQHQNDKLKENSIGEILNKINRIAVQSLSKADHKGKLEILKKVEEKLTKAAKSLGKKGESYVKIIMKGIKAKAFENNTSVETLEILDEIPINNTSNDKSFKFEQEGGEDIRKLNHIIETEIKLNTDTENNLLKTQENQLLNNTEESKLRRTNVGINVNGSNIISNPVNIMETTTKHLIQSFISRYDCESALDRTCMNIKEMRQLKCLFGETAVPIEKLCNGFVDCPYRTDEKFCTSQVTERVRNANLVISKALESLVFGCFPNISKKSIMTTQIITFRSILQTQEEFVEKYKYLNSTLVSNNTFEGIDAVERTVNELSSIINALALALDATLCSERIKPINVLNTRKFGNLIDEDLDEVIKDFEWPPKSCVCKRDRCENLRCTDSCKRICWQKYSLTQWGCESINKTETVPMSAICDGKFDCFDQSDEKGCIIGNSFAKFQAHEIFKEILTTLSGKISSTEYSSARNILLSLHNSIENLQIYCMNSEPDIKIISRLRNKCFSTLGSIYWDIFSKSSHRYETEEAYLFLLSINKNLVNAIKRSNSGNDKIVTSFGCHCRNGLCSMSVCSRKCIRSCIAEPVLTRYYCENSNKSIPLDEVCNNHRNCPLEDDERDCKKDLCRRHHLSILRNSLQNVGKKQEGTSMGELLRAWKIKASSMLILAEDNNRPTPIIMRGIVKDILNDLVITYGAVQDYRRNNGYALEEFTKIAWKIMETLRWCDK